MISLQHENINLTEHGSYENAYNGGSGVLLPDLHAATIGRFIGATSYLEASLYGAVSALAKIPHLTATRLIAEPGVSKLVEILRALAKDIELDEVQGKRLEEVKRLVSYINAVRSRVAHSLPDWSDQMLRFNKSGFSKHLYDWEKYIFPVSLKCLNNLASFTEILSNAVYQFAHSSETDSKGDDAWMLLAGFADAHTLPADPNQLLGVLANTGHGRR